MTPHHWTMVPGKLKAEGFQVDYQRISYEPGKSQWRASAYRDGQEWTAYGNDLGSVCMELERLTHNSVASNECATLASAEEAHADAGGTMAGGNAA